MPDSLTVGLSIPSSEYKPERDVLSVEPPTVNGNTPIRIGREHGGGWEQIGYAVLTPDEAYDVALRLLEQSHRFAVQCEAITRLREGGWKIRAWFVEEASGKVCVDGRDNYGDAFRGSIDAAGDLTGEPCDPGEEPVWLGLAQDKDYTSYGQRDAAEDDPRGVADDGRVR